MKTTTVSRRKFMKRAALATTAAIAAPYMRTSYAAGRLTMGFWDHWVPGANDTLDEARQGVGREEQGRGEDRLHHLAGRQGHPDRGRGGAGGTGHDIMPHAVAASAHRRRARAGRRRGRRADQAERPDRHGREYLAKTNGKWLGVPATVGSQVKPCCSRLDLYKQHCRHRPADDVSGQRGQARPRLVDSWNWDTYLKGAEKLFKGGYPVRPAMGQTSDTVDSIGAIFRAFGAVMVDEKGNIKIKSDRDPRGARISQEADGRSIRPTSTPGTMPATTSGSSPARARGS